MVPWLFFFLFLGQSSVCSGSPAGSTAGIPQSDAATVVYGDYVMVDGPSAASDVSASSSISQKAPNTDNENPPPAPPGLQLQGDFKPPFPPLPPYFPTGPHINPQQIPMPTQEQWQQYCLAMSKYGPPPMMQSPHMFMQPRPFPTPDHQFRMPYMMPGPSGNIPVQTPQVFGDAFPVQHSKGAGENSTEGSKVEETAMDTSEGPSQSKPTEANKTSTDGNELEDFLHIKKPKMAMEPSTSSDLEAQPEVGKPALLPDEFGKAQSPGLIKMHPDLTPNTSTSPSPRPASVQHVASETDAQPAIEFTNKGVFGGLASNVPEKNSPQIESPRLSEFGMAGGGDSRSVDEKSQPSGMGEQNAGEHEVLYMEQESLKKLSEELISSGRKAFEALPSELTSMKEKSNGNENSRTSSEASPEKPNPGKISPKRASDSDITEIDEKFKKLRRIDIPESPSYQDEMVAGEKLATITSASLRPYEVPACSSQSEAVACESDSTQPKHSTELQENGQATDPGHNGASAEEIDRPYLDEGGKMTGKSVREEREDGMYPPDDQDMTHQRQGDKTLQTEELNKISSEKMPVPALTKYGKPGLDEERKEPEADVTGTTTDAVNRNKCQDHTLPQVKTSSKKQCDSIQTDDQPLQREATVGHSKSEAAPVADPLLTPSENDELSKQKAREDPAASPASDQVITIDSDTPESQDPLNTASDQVITIDSSDAPESQDPVNTDQWVCMVKNGLHSNAVFCFFSFITNSTDMVSLRVFFT